MNEYFAEITNSSNIIPTLLLGLVTLYWLLVIFGAIGMDVLDFDMDADADLDGDLELGDGVLGAMFAFFHVGQVPLMLIVSFFALFFWLTTICCNHYLNPEFNFVTTVMWMIPCGFVSLAATKVCVMPIARVLRTQDKRWERNEVIGKTAVVHTLELNQDYGEIVFNNQVPPLVLNARNETGQTLRKGDVVMVVAHDRENDICLVELAKLENSK